jgi:hypothetical protein
VRRKAALIAVSAALAVAVAAPSAASAAGPQWVSVNACVNHMLGVRASQPGDAFDSSMFTQFSAQWLNRGVWTAIPGSESPWLTAGPGPWLNAETGWNRTFAPAPAGQSFTLRGVVVMQWRGDAGVIRTRTLVTPQTCTLR